MNFFDAKELQTHAMKCRYGWFRFLKFGVDSDIKTKAFQTVLNVKLKNGPIDEYQARLDFIREFPIKD